MQHGSSSLHLKQVSVMKGHEGAVWNVKFSSNGKYCMSGGHDRTVRLWNPHSGLHIQTYKGHSYEVLDLAITEDNSKFASCGKERSILLWDIERADEGTSRRIRAHDHTINSVAFNKAANVLLSASEDKTVKIWDLASRNRDPIQVLNEATDSVTTVTVNGYEIITGSVDGCVRCYDIRMGKLRTDVMHSPVINVSLSNDGNCILVGCLNSSLRILSKDDGTLFRTYEGHTNSKYLLKSSLTYDDANVASGSEDNKIYIWDMVDNKIIQILSGHHKMVCGLMCHPDELILLSSSVDGSIRLWK